MAKEPITLAVILDHIKGLASGVHILERQFGRLDKRMGGMEKQMDGMDIRMSRLETKVDNGFTEMRDHIRYMESHDLPRRVSRLEDKVFAGVDA